MAAMAAGPPPEPEPAKEPSVPAMAFAPQPGPDPAPTMAAVAGVQPVPDPMDTVAPLREDAAEQRLADEGQTGTATASRKRPKPEAVMLALGTRVQVFLPKARGWYRGKVVEHKARLPGDPLYHRVQYDDGDLFWHDLANTQYCPDEDEEDEVEVEVEVEDEVEQGDETSNGRPPTTAAEVLATAALAAAEKEGLTLLTSTGAAGYKGVTVEKGMFRCRYFEGGLGKPLGTFHTAEEAALAYARALREKEMEEAVNEEDEEEADEEDEGEGEEEAAEEEEAEEEREVRQLRPSRQLRLWPQSVANLPPDSCAGEATCQQAMSTMTEVVGRELLVQEVCRLSQIANSPVAGGNQAAGAGASSAATPNVAGTPPSAPAQPPQPPPPQEMPQQQPLAPQQPSEA